MRAVGNEEKWLYKRLDVLLVFVFQGNRESWTKLIHKCEDLRLAPLCTVITFTHTRKVGSECVQRCTATRMTGTPDN